MKNSSARDYRRGTRDGCQTDGNRSFDSISWTPGWGPTRAFLALVSLPKLEELWVGPPIGEKGMAIIAKMPKLSTLVAVITRDNALVPLKEIRNPVTLNLSNSRITDAALAHLVKLPKLQNLMLYKTPITDASLPYLKRLKRLKLLEVGGTDLSEAAIGQLSAAMPDTQVSWGEPRTCFPDPTAESNKEEEKR